MDRGRETRNRDARKGTENGRQETETYKDWGQWTVGKEQRRETGDRELETRNRDVRLGAAEERQGTETQDRGHKTGDEVQRRERGDMRQNGFRICSASD